MRALFIIHAAGIHSRILDVLFQNFCHEVLVAPTLWVVAVQEVGIIAVGLKLTDRTIKAVYTPEVGQGAR